VRHAFREGNETLFVAADKILRWDGKAFQIWPLPAERPLAAFRIDGKILVHHRPTGVYVMERDGPKLTIPAAAIGDTQTLLLETRGNELLAVTGRGLGIYAQEKLEIIEGPATEFLKTQQATAALALPDGRIAIASYKGGIAFIRRDGSLEQTLSAETGLPTSQLTGLFLDREGALWATSFSHLVRIAFGASTLFAERAGLPSSLYHRIVIHENQVYAGTHDALYRFDRQLNRFSELVALRGRSSELRSAPDGLLIASFQAVRRFADGEVQEAYKTKQSTYATLPLAAGEFFVAEENRVTKVSKDGETSVATTPDITLSLAQDQGGRLWLGTQKNGVFVVTPSSAPGPATPRPPPELGPDATRGMGIVRMGRNGEVFAFTDGGGWILRGNPVQAERVANYPQRKRTTRPR
jgi:hypothetical protein